MAQLRPIRRSTEGETEDSLTTDGGSSRLKGGLRKALLGVGLLAVAYTVTRRFRSDEETRPTEGEGGFSFGESGDESGELKPAGSRIDDSGETAEADTGATEETVDAMSEEGDEETADKETADELLTDEESTQETTEPDDMAVDEDEVGADDLESGEDADESE